MSRNRKMDQKLSIFFDNAADMILSRTETEKNERIAHAKTSNAEHILALAEMPRNYGARDAEPINITKAGFRDYEYAAFCDVLRSMRRVYHGAGPRLRWRIIMMLAMRDFTKYVNANKINSCTKKPNNDRVR